VDEIVEFAVFPLIIVVRFRNKVDIIVPYGDTLFWISADISKIDLE